MQSIIVIQSINYDKSKQMFVLAIKSHEKYRITKVAQAAFPFIILKQRSICNCVNSGPTVKLSS